jgi:hypothetical protein
MFYIYNYLVLFILMYAADCIVLGYLKLNTSAIKYLYFFTVHVTSTVSQCTSFSIIISAMMPT